MKRNSPLCLLTSLSLAIVLLIASCQKGDTGPAGQTGAAGSQGPQGPKGDTGTANVIYSNWLNINYSPDTLNNGGIIDTIGYFAYITAPKLTGNIISSGEMKVYLNLGTTTTPDVIPLPYTDPYSGLNISVSYRIDTIALYANANVSTLTQSGSTYLQYRYLLIPGSVSTQSIHVDWKNYNTVKNILGLPN
jgi:hypothetical protein